MEREGDVVLKYSNGQDQKLYIYVEPFAEQYQILPGEKVDFILTQGFSGALITGDYFHLSHDKGGITFWWEGNGAVRLMLDGKQMKPFEER